MPRQQKPLSPRLYAQLRGYTQEAVRKAIDSGRLKASLVYDVRGKPKIADVELADREWAANTRPRIDEPLPNVKSKSARGRARKPAPVASEPAPDEPETGGEWIDYNEARRRREVENWKLAAIERERADLDLAARRGELVEASNVADRWVEAVTAAKTKLLGVPSRLRQRHPDADPAIFRDNDDLIREALEELADGR